MATIRIANAPCSWGSLEFEGFEGQAIPYGQMLDELKETGYRGTELGDWGYMPTEPERLHAELARRGLVMLGAFVPVALKDSDAHEGGIAESVKIARLLSQVAKMGDYGQLPFLALADDNGTDAVRTANAGRTTSEMSLSDGQWAVFACGAESVARQVKSQTGLRTVFHHHCAGYVERPDEVARLLDMTDPELLGLVFDTGHYAYGSGSNNPDTVLDGLGLFAERIWYMHFKDCDPKVADGARAKGWDYFEAVRRGVFCELGHGCVDFPAVLRWLNEQDYDGWAVVEQDVLPGTGSPKQSAQRNREYLRGHGV
ncbi:MAG: TIM barrel protein [Phycisphaerales bacterium]|nr:MAG: TIM barrel protein [Phycisphaerales bacterium]